MAQVGVLDEKKYGTLLGKLRPRLIESHQEWERLAAALEALDLRDEEAALGIEERELQRLLRLVVTEYEDRVAPDPELSPVEMLKYIMEQRGLRQVDLLDVFGSRAVASQVLSGRRQISKAQAIRLAARFKVSTDLFIG